MPKSKGRRRGKPARRPAGRSGSPRVVESQNPPTSGRYTPRLSGQVRLRPAWHRAIGLLVVVFGLGIFVMNDLAWVGVRLMPGGTARVTLC